MTAGKIAVRGGDAQAVLSLAADLAACRDADELRDQSGRAAAIVGAEVDFVSACREWGRDVELLGGDPGLYGQERLEAVGRGWRDTPCSPATSTGPRAAPGASPTTSPGPSGATATCSTSSTGRWG